MAELKRKQGKFSEAIRTNRSRIPKRYKPTLPRHHCTQHLRTSVCKAT
jgi:hypothetical protein